jgi:hypothetical protein
MNHNTLSLITQALKEFKIPSYRIKEDSHMLFDLNLNTNHIDSLFSTLEKQYDLRQSLMFSHDVATLRGLSQYVERMIVK